MNTNTCIKLQTYGTTNISNENNNNNYSHSFTHIDIDNGGHCLNESNNSIRPYSSSKHLQLFKSKYKVQYDSQSTLLGSNNNQENTIISMERDGSKYRRQLRARPPARNLSTGNRHAATDAATMIKKNTNPSATNEPLPATSSSNDHETNNLCLDHRSDEHLQLSSNRSAPAMGEDESSPFITSDDTSNDTCNTGDDEEDDEELGHSNYVRANNNHDNPKKSSGITQKLSRKKLHNNRHTAARRVAYTSNNNNLMSSKLISSRPLDDTDHDGDIERSDNDHDDDDDDDDDHYGDPSDSDGLGASDNKSSANLIYNQRLTSYKANECSPRTSPSDMRHHYHTTTTADANTTQSGLYRSRLHDSKTSNSRLRMRLTTTTTTKSKLVQDKLELGDECECIRRGVQNLHFDDLSLSSLTRVHGSEAQDYNNNNNNNSNNLLHQDNCHLYLNTSEELCGKNKKNYNISGQSSYNKLTTDKCSEPSRWLGFLSELPSKVRELFSSNNRSLLITQHSGSGGGGAAAGKRTRRKDYSSSAVELDGLNLSTRSYSKRNSDQSIKSFEWKEQQAAGISVIGASGGSNHQDSKTTTTTIMPNNNYGSATGSSSQQRSQRSSVGRRYSTARSATHPRGSNGYLRLGNEYYYQKTTKSSFFQEYAPNNFLSYLSLKRAILLLIIIAICGLVLWQIYLILIEESNYLGTVKYSPSELGQFKHYAVSTDAEPCAKVGRRLLAKGGHAVDAAIGTLICMGVTLPNSLGLGGGCLMTIYDNVTKTAVIIDGRETAPDYATETMFASNPLSSSRGPLSVGVPGELAAYYEAHKRFGRLQWADLFTDSIEMAEKGFATPEHLAAAFRNMEHAKYITPPLAKILTNNATGDYYSEGELMYELELAATLKRIRDHGVDEFYNGPTGQMFIEDLQQQGGKMTMDNLRRYQALVRPAVEFKLSDELKVYTQAVPGSGVVLSIILRIMKELGYFKNMKPHSTFQASSLYYHHLAEAFKFAYAQRAGLEDQPDDPARMEQLIAKITSEQFIKDAVSKIDNSKTQPSSVYGGLQYFQEDHGTAHTSVVDSEGNSIAVTTSVNLYFGSGLVSPRTGIIYNDVMDDFTSPNITNKFSLLPSKYNRIRPGKRPLSSMAPSVFVDGSGNPRLIIGASGGAKITTAIATVALRNLFFDEDIKTAIDGPRIHHQFLPETVWHEANFPPEILTTLKDRGHGLTLITGRSSVVMAIACNYTTTTPNRSNKIITANSDYRKGGSVDGL